MIFNYVIFKKIKKDIYRLLVYLIFKNNDFKKNKTHFKNKGR